MKVELAVFVGRLDVEFQRKRGVKDGCKRNLAWASRRMELLLTEMVTGKIRSPVGQVQLEVSFGHPGGDF